MFGSIDEVRMAYDHGEVDLQAKIKCRIVDSDGKRIMVETTVGRVLLYDICAGGHRRSRRSTA